MQSDYHRELANGWERASDMECEGERSLRIPDSAKKMCNDF
jgi:hypothetical protein